MCNKKKHNERERIHYTVHISVACRVLYITAGSCILWKRPKNHIIVWILYTLNQLIKARFFLGTIFCSMRDPTVYVSNLMLCVSILLG